MLALLRAFIACLVALWMPEEFADEMGSALNLGKEQDCE